jgi:hypothetical protein
MSCRSRSLNKPQGVDLNKDGVRKLIQDIMALRDNPLSQTQVDEIFEDTWPRLEAKVDDAMQQSPDVESPSRSPEEMLEEVLEGVRRIEREQSRLEALECRSDQGYVTFVRTATDTARASDHVGPTSSPGFLDETRPLSPDVIALLQRQRPPDPQENE